jgi:branched-subunit amino acid aminotransferase/4-amino-4-deoxychorismate lyase
VFLVLSGELRTPPLGTPVLPGVVRGAVIELCGALDISCDAEAPLTIHDALAAEEMFLTSSCSGIRPVVRVERHAVGDAKPGPVTRTLMAAYEDLLVRECGPRKEG